MPRLALFLSIAFALVACDDPVETNLDAADINDLVNAHNAARDGVSPPPPTPMPDLQWSSSLASDAAKWAAKCVFGHSGNGHGENIYATTGMAEPGAVIASWVSEEADYDYATNACAADEVCGHYTQVVWADSTHVGCAKHACTTGSPFGGGSGSWEIWVCDYDPPGNYVGEKPY